MIKRRRKIYNVGDLLIEIIDGIHITSGIITNYRFDKFEKDYVYSIMWNDMPLDTELYESVIAWRIKNEVFIYYSVVK